MEFTLVPVVITTLGGSYRVPRTALRIFHVLADLILAALEADMTTFHQI